MTQMPQNDELRELWNCDTSAKTAQGDEIMEAVQQRTQRFDRAIRNRNLRECIAAAIVFAIFLWNAVTAPDAFTRAGSIIIATSAVWIAFHLMHYGRAKTAVIPDQSLMSYTQSLMASYDRQIRLSKTVLYWYLLLPYIGLLTYTAGLLLDHAKAGNLNWRYAIYPAIYTLMFAAVWWLNAVYAVRRLRASREKLLAMTEYNDSAREETK